MCLVLSRPAGRHAAVALAMLLLVAGICATAPRPARAQADGAPAAADHQARWQRQPPALAAGALERLQDRIAQVTEHYFRRPNLELPLRHTYVYFVQSMLADFRPLAMVPALERIVALELGDLPADLTVLERPVALDLLAAARVAARDVLAVLNGRQAIDAARLTALDQAGLSAEDPYLAQLQAAHAASLLYLSGDPVLADALAAGVDDPYGRLVWALAGVELAWRAGDRAGVEARLATAKGLMPAIDDLDNRAYYALSLAFYDEALGRGLEAWGWRRLAARAIDQLVGDGLSLDYAAMGQVRDLMWQGRARDAGTFLETHRAIIAPALHAGLAAFVSDLRTGRVPAYLWRGDADSPFLMALVLQEYTYMVDLAATVPAAAAAPQE